MYLDIIGWDDGLHGGVRRWEGPVSLFLFLERNKHRNCRQRCGLGERPHSVFVHVLTRALHMYLPCICIENAGNSKFTCVKRGFVRARRRCVAAP